MRFPLTTCGVLIALSLVTTQTTAATEPSLDTILEGFDDTAPVAEDTAAEPSLDAVLEGFDNSDSDDRQTQTVIQEEKSWQLGGAISLGGAWNYAHDAPDGGETDYRGLSRLRGKLNLDLDMAFSDAWRSRLSGYGYYDAVYAINGRDEYGDEVLDEYESEIELGEAWLQGRLNKQTDIKLGRQIVVWGKSDNIRVTDVLNPLDNREPGMVDIEDLRLPLTMARLDYYSGEWGISAIAIPEIRFNKNPPYGSDFYPYPAPLPKEITPEDGGGDTEYALAANGIFSGWDLSLYWAQLYDDSPHLIVNAGSPELRHNRLTMQGLAVNAAVENWLLKAEAAYFSGLEYDSIPNKKLSRLDTLLGIEYSGFSETTLSLEVVNRHINDYEAVLLYSGVDEDIWQTALRYQGDFLHARLHLLALISVFGEAFDQGSFSRYSAAYDIADALTVTTGVVSYEGGGQAPFDALAENDRLFVDIKYSF